MKKSTLLLFCMFFPLLLIGQKEDKHSFLGRNWRLWASSGPAISTTAGQIEKALSKNGFGDQSTISLFGLGGTVDYPTSKRGFFYADLTVERKLAEGTWLGLAGWLGPKVSATGFDRTGHTNLILIESTRGRRVEMKHGAWYLSPQISHEVPEGNFEVFGGPTFGFHTLQTDWGTSESFTSQRQTRIGGVFGTRVNMAGRFKWLLSYQMSPKVNFDPSTFQQVEGANTIEFSLPAIKAGTGHLRLGVAFWI